MTDVITQTLSPDLVDPDLMKLATPTVRTREAAALRVAAGNSHSPIQLTAGADTPESILSERFREITNARPDAAQRTDQRATAALRSPATQPRLAQTTVPTPTADELLSLIDASMRYLASSAAQRGTRSIGAGRSTSKRRARRCAQHSSSTRAVWCRPPNHGCLAALRKSNSSVHQAVDRASHKLRMSITTDTQPLPLRRETAQPKQPDPRHAPAVAMRRGVILLASMLAVSSGLAVAEARAFWPSVHKEINDVGLSGDRGAFLSRHVRSELKQMHDDIDGGAEAGYDERHFDDCEFNGGAKYIRDRFFEARSRLGSTGRIWDAPDSLGRALHPAQDFYAHSNWVELGFPRSDLRNTPGIEVSLSDLIDFSGAQSSIAQRWFAPGNLGVVRDDILRGPENGYVATAWRVAPHGGGTFVPVVIDADGTVRGRLLESGMSWGEDECEIRFGNETTAFSGFSHAALNKDGPRARPLDHRRARALATLQTGYEWCRLVHEAGVVDTGVLLTVWMKDGADPHPAGTPCASAPPGPKRVTVTVQSVRVLDNGDKRGRGEVQLAAALYDNSQEFRRSRHTTRDQVSIGDRALVPRDRLPRPMTLCVDTDDGASFALHAWDNDQDDGDHASDRTEFDNHDDDDELLLGGQREVVPPGTTGPMSATRSIRSADLEIVYRVAAGGDNSACPQPPPPPPRKPDLVISGFRLGEFAVANRGAAAAGPFTVTLAGFDEFRFPGLAAGATTRMTYSAPCQMEHRAIADSHAEVDESDETNNVATFTPLC